MPFKDESVQPTGIGGWLVLPVLITLLTPLRLLVPLIQSSQSLPQVVALSAPPMKVYLLGESLVIVGLVLGWAYTAIILFERRRSFPATFNTLLVATLAYSSLVLVLALFGIGGPVQRNNIGAVISGALACAIWIPYMQQSVRVRNTFGLERAWSDAAETDARPTLSPRQARMVRWGASGIAVLAIAAAVGVAFQVQSDERWLFVLGGFFLAGAIWIAGQQIGSID
jgi:hypothetical protein